MSHYARLFRRMALNILMRFVSPLVSRRKQFWLIGMDDGGGAKFSGNAWYFFKYLREQQPQVDIRVIASSPHTQEAVLNLGGQFAKPDSLKAAWWGLRAGVYIVAGEMGTDIPNFVDRNVLKVHLWHGVPLKQIYYASAKMMERRERRSWRQKILESMCGYVPPEDYDFIALTSEHLRPLMQKSFGNKKLYLTGHARDDLFFVPTPREQLLREVGLQDHSHCKVISYLPTFRDVTANDLSYKIFSENTLAQKLLEQKNILVVQKNHNSRLKERSFVGPCLYLPEDVDTQKLLLASDAIITDYSSVYIDYLHLQRPIFFYPYDIETYQSLDRGFNFDYYDDKITPGPKAVNEQQLLDFILSWADRVECMDSFVAQRQISWEYFHSHRDGKACERTFAKVKQLLTDC